MGAALVAAVHDHGASLTLRGGAFVAARRSHRRSQAPGVPMVVAKECVGLVTPTSRLRRPLGMIGGNDDAALLRSFAQFERVPGAGSVVAPGRQFYAGGDFHRSGPGCAIIRAAAIPDAPRTLTLEYCRFRSVPGRVDQENMPLRILSIERVHHRRGVVRLQGSVLRDGSDRAPSLAGVVAAAHYDAHISEIRAAIEARLGKGQKRSSGRPDNSGNAIAGITLGPIRKDRDEAGK